MFTIIGGDGREYGPATVEQIRGWIAAGRANLETKAKAIGTDEWRRLGDFAEFGTQAGVPPITTTPAAGAEGVPTVELADRVLRLGAVFVDYVFAFLCYLPGIILAGTSVLVAMMRGQYDAFADPTPRMQLGMLLLGAAGLIVLIVQITLLTSRGQTVGKRLLGVRIVRYTDNTNPGFVSAVLLRWFVPSIICVLPFVGVVFFFVDILFIFRDDRRCLHDLIAGTRVVKAESPLSS